MAGRSVGCPYPSQYPTIATSRPRRSVRTRESRRRRRCAGRGARHRRGRSSPADDRWRDEAHHLVHQPGVEERSQQRAAALDEHTRRVAAAQLREKGGQVHGAVVRRCAHHAGARPLKGTAAHFRSAGHGNNGLAGSANMRAVGDSLPVLSTTTRVGCRARGLPCAFLAVS